MKKYYIILCLMVLIMVMCGCGNNESKQPSNQEISNNSSITSTKSDINQNLIYDSEEAFQYTEVEDGIAIIWFENYDHIKYSKIIIPSEIDNKKVVGIGSLDKNDCWVFGDFACPCEVVIPNSVSYIGGMAFFGVKNLIKVSGGENCKTLGDYSFADCEDLEEVTFYNNLETISDSAFIGCDKLQQVMR